MTKPELDELRLVDRSRNLSYHDCNRRRFLGYEWGGTGLSKIRASIPLFVGQCVHTGLASLLNGLTPDQAVSDALAEYEGELKRRGLELEPGEDASYVADESRALIEALVRVYALQALPALFEQYEVLEVEREDLWQDFAPGIGWMSRADGLLLEKETQDLYVLSFKTAAQWDSRTDRQNQHDVQGLSEVAAIEARLAEWWELLKRHKEKGMPLTYDPNRYSSPEDAGLPSVSIAKLLLGAEAPPRILGVKMVYLLKGRREQYPEDSGHWQTSSHLLRGWIREGVTGQEFAWRYKWFGPDRWDDTYTTGQSEGRLKGHTLGKGWKRFNTWEANGGVKAWIDLLATGSVQPDAGDPFESVIYEPQPYYRQQQDMEDWYVQTAWQEETVAENAKWCEAIRERQPEDLRRELNRRFPQNRHSCDYPSKCQFQEICFGDNSMLINPLGSGLYERRQPHHTPEAEKVAQLAK